MIHVQQIDDWIFRVQILLIIPKDRRAGTGTTLGRSILLTERGGPSHEGGTRQAHFEGGQRVTETQTAHSTAHHGQIGDSLRPRAGR